jgi:hypothetical protein
MDNKETFPSFIFGDANTCTYCGDIATDIEHVIPWSYFSDCARTGKSRSQGIRTYSCRKCNTTFADKLFTSFQDRMDFIKDRHEFRAKRYFNKSKWTNEEIEELKDQLKLYVKHKQYEANLAIRKTKWVDGIGFRICIKNLKTCPYVDPLNKKYKDWIYEFFIGYL